MIRIQSFFITSIQTKKKDAFIELMFCDPVGCKKWFSLHGVCGETKPLSV